MGTTTRELLQLYTLKNNQTTNQPSGANEMESFSIEHVSAATRILDKRRQMLEVQEALDAQKEEFAKKEDAFQRREEALRRKDLELQESLLKFNRFLQENESKRSRAVKRAQEERKQREAKEAEIIKLRIQTQEKMSEEKKLRIIEEENAKFQHYLASVVDYASKDYAEMEDLLNRYRILVLANKDLLERQEVAETENDQLTVDYATYIKERTNEVLNQSNQIASLQKKMETCTMAVLRQQNIVDESIGAMSSKTLELWQTLGSVENLLDRCEQGLKTKVIKKRAEAKTRAPVDVEAEGLKAMIRLEAIAMYMTDFQSIMVDFQREQEMLRRSAIVMESNA